MITIVILAAWCGLAAFQICAATFSSRCGAAIRVANGKSNDFL